jgi:hypothetical protein
VELWNCGALEVWIQVFLISTLGKWEWSPSRPNCFILITKASNWRRDSMGLRTSLNSLGPRRIPYPCRESSPNSSAIQLVARRCMDCVLKGNNTLYFRTTILRVQRRIAVGLLYRTVAISRQCSSVLTPYVSFVDSGLKVIGGCSTTFISRVTHLGYQGKDTFNQYMVR